MFSSNVVFGAAVLVCIQTVAAFGQPIEDIQDAESISRGEQLILELSKARQLMPPKWACMMKYSVEAAPDANDYIHIKGKSYTAVDSKNGVEVRRLKQANNQPGPHGFGSIETMYFDWQKGRERIKWDDGEWRVPKAGEIAPHLDPLMMCVSHTEVLEYGISSDYVEQMFLGGVRSCLGSFETKTGVTSVWGKPKAEPRLGFAWFVLHDKETNLPIEFRSKVYPVWDPAKLDVGGKVIQHSTTTWKKHDNGTIVPVEIHGNWNNNDEPFEAIFEFQWLFGDDLPERLFEDPRTSPTKLGEFPKEHSGNKEEDENEEVDVDP